MDFLWQRIVKLPHTFDKILGISSLEKLQHRTVQAENEYIKSMGDRKDVEFKIENIRNKLDKMNMLAGRSEPSIEGLVEERDLINKCKELYEQHKLHSKRESDCFINLTNALRKSHHTDILQMRANNRRILIISISTSIVSFLGWLLVSRYRKYKIVKLISHSRIVEGEHESVCLVKQHRSVSPRLASADLVSEPDDIDLTMNYATFFLVAATVLYKLMNKSG
ncbi:hypothetical protein GJ496_004577 [Pomphorhynchus laevis]|nr:hypothetical protein GJ496_004577 [Pomphorhynchus laevis]